MSVDVVEGMETFAPATRRWFADTFGDPTVAQRRAWPAIASGDNVLVVAPTGSGKTLAAFLSAIDQLMRVDASVRSGAATTKSGHGVRVLYISPLKALAVDVARNLTEPLTGIRERCRIEGSAAPTIRVAIRSGDTSAKERRSIASHPPDILVTTPESLYLLLTSKAGRILSDVRTVIIDEVHALAGSKRGAHLALSLERLELLTASPVQRIGLSATVRPAEEAARFIGGGRPVTVIGPTSSAGMELRIQSPFTDADAEPDDAQGAQDHPSSVWPAIERSVLDEVLRHHTTLVFVNSRGLAEKLTARLNDRYAGDVLGHDGDGRDDKGHDMQENNGVTADAGDAWNGGQERPVSDFDAPHIDSVVGSTTMLVGSHADGDVIAMAHHGSVSKERRKRIEEDLKRGRLRCVVATSSLELGIDMGSVDMVIQIAPPMSVASGLQRVGRADHQVGGVSHAVFYPLTPRQLITMGATIEGMRSGDLEPLKVLRNPLDVLAQQTVAAVAMHGMEPGEWYGVARRAAPFSKLDRDSFDAVIDMLTGGYNTEEFSSFRPPLAFDDDRRVIIARPGAQRLAVTSGGTIPDRGLYTVVVPQTEGQSGPRRVGELDEEMVYESRVGDVITLGTSAWRIQEITHDRVVVVPAPGRTARLPFWHGDEAGRDVEFALVCARFTHDVAGGLIASAAGRPAGFDARTMRRLHDDGMDDPACSSLARLLDEQRRATDLIPDDRSLVIERCLDDEDDWRVILHSPYGRRVHEPWALAISRRLQARYGFDGQCYAHDDGIVVRIPQAQEELSDDAIFRFDPDELRRDVEAQVSGSVLFATRFRECAARSLYMPRTRPGKRVPLWQQRLRASQLLAAAKTRHNFPLLLETARECLQDVYDMPALTRLMRDIDEGSVSWHAVRTDAPSPFADDLLFGVVGAVMYQSDIPQAERNVSLLSMDMDALERLIGTRHIAQVLDPGVIAQVEAELSSLHFWNQLEETDLTGRIRRFAKTHGPFTADELIARLDVDARQAVHELDAMQSAGELITGTFTTGTSVAGIADAGTAVVRSAVQYLHRDVLARIRSRSLAKARRAIAPVRLDEYQRFVMRRQGVGPVGEERHAGENGLIRVIEQLEGLSLPASLWEQAVFPARVRGYEPSMLDAALASGQIMWVADSTGQGNGAGGGTGDVAWYPAGSPLIDAVDGQAAQSRLATVMLRVLQSGGAYPARRLFERCRAILAATETGTDAATADDALTVDTATVGDVEGNVDVETGEIVAPAFHASAERMLPGSSRLSDEECERVLWSLVWRGTLTNSSFMPIRARVGQASRRSAMRRGDSTGLRGDLREGLYGERRVSMRGGLRSSTRSSTPPELGGLWSIVEPSDAPERAALARIDALLDRYGLIAQPLVDREAIPGGFSGLYPVLRRLEDAGVLMRGVFVTGLGAAQFARRETIDELRSVRDLHDVRCPGTSPDIMTEASQSAASAPRALSLSASMASISDVSDVSATADAHVRPATTRHQAAIALDTMDPANLAGWIGSWPPTATETTLRPSHRAGNVVVFMAGRPVLYAAASGHHLLGFVRDMPMAVGAPEPTDQGSREVAPGGIARLSGLTRGQLVAALAQLGAYSTRAGRRTVTFADIDGARFDRRNRFTSMMREAGFTFGPRGMTWYR